MRTIVLVSRRLRKKSTIDEGKDKTPRDTLFDTAMNAYILDEEAMQKVPVWRRRLYKFLPYIFSQVMEAYFVRNNYDLVVCWSESHTLLFALILKLTFTKFPNIGLVYWISKPKKAIFLKFVFKHITKLITWSSVQRSFAIKQLNIPASKIKLIRYQVDQKFYRPMQCNANLICSAGREMRDFVTLIEAMTGLDINCHIAVKLDGGKIYDTVKTVYKLDSLPGNVTVGAMPSIAALRSLYASSKFVVIPLLPSDSENGLTVILEAMAMGKAVICSKTKGQSDDVILDGITGIFVPQCNPAALRNAIIYLWNHPDVADKMGKEGRKRIEEKFTLEKFVTGIKTIADEVVKRERLVYDNDFNGKEIISDEIS